jgi:hypothetical protein
MHSGTHGPFQWIAAPHLPDLAVRVRHSHQGLRLHIAAFDSGPISPTVEELAAGWEPRGHGMLSPPLTHGMLSPPLTALLELPYEGTDEWYVLDERSRDIVDPEVFVNNHGFTLTPAVELYAAFDPTWERGVFDWLAPVQERFWTQLARLDPVTYVAMGGLDIVVTRHPTFLAALQETLTLT